MSVEAVKSFFDIGTVVLLFLTFAFGAGVLITGNIINSRQAKQLRKFDEDLTGAKTELAIQQTRAATAERDVAEAKKSAGDADAKAEAFRLDIAKANERAALANERAASLQVEAAKLRKELVLQGARENLLSKDNRRNLIATLKPFAGQKIDVRYSATALMVNSTVISSAPLGDDTVGFANALARNMLTARRLDRQFLEHRRQDGRNSNRRNPSPPVPK